MAMNQDQLPETDDTSNVDDAAESLPPATRVVLDPGSPSVRSIVRIVLITLVILFTANWIQAAIVSIVSLLFIIVLGVFVAYLLDPIVRLIRRPFKDSGTERWMPRWLAIIITYLIVFTVSGSIIAGIAPSVSEQGREFAANLPALGVAVRDRARDVNRRFDRLRIPDEIQAELNKKATEIGANLTESIGNSVLLFFTYLPWVLLVPILAFFFLKDVNTFRLAILKMFPVGRWRYRADSIMADLNTTIAAYVRAQLISCVIIAFLCTLGFYVIGLKYALLLGILAGIFEFVPLLGPLTIAIIVILTAAASDHPWNALYAAIFLIVLRIIHDYVTYPRIVRGGLHLHPLAIIMAVLAGEQVAGIPGVFLSIPVVAVVTVFYRHILEHQGRTRGIVSGLIEDVEAKPEEAPQ